MHRDPDVVTLERFVFRLSALSSDDWGRLASGVTPLRGDAIDAVWRRAELEALAEPGIARWARIPAQVAGVVAALVDELSPGSLSVAPSISVHDVRRPGGRRYLELLADTHDLVAANAPGDDGAAAAVLGAALALAGRAGDADESLVRAYRYVEPVIPLSSVIVPPEATPEPPAEASPSEPTDPPV